MLAQAGLGPGDYTLVYTGLATLPALLSGSVAAVGAFRNFEPFAVEEAGRTPVFFPQEEYGVPNTYELLFVAHPAVVRERTREIRAVLGAVAEGIRLTQEDPPSAFALFARAFPELADELNRRSFEATLPLYAPGARHEDTSRWAAVQDFLLAAGMMVHRFPIVDLYTTDFLPRKGELVAQAGVG
jgi:putative hydroxymethylpyrimidine transport system substrate-binding protein